MPTFEYRAQNVAGEAVSGVVFGASLDHAARDLASKGLQVTHLGVTTNLNDPLAAPVAVAEPIGAGGRAVAAPRVERPATAGLAPAPSTEQRSYMATSVWGPLVGQVPLAKLYFFFKQLSTMLNSGVPIVQCLDTLSKQAGNAKLESIVKEIRDHAVAGRPMSAGMQRYPEVFSPLIVSVTRAGEEGGFTAPALMQISDYLEKEIALRNLYKKLTLWPKIELFASIVIIIVANMIIASIKPDARGLNSPLTTPATWIVLGPLIVGAFFFFRVGLANPAVKYNWDTVMTNLPGLGTMLRELSAAKFGRAFSALHRAGVPLPKGMQMSADACGNEFLRSKIYPVAARLNEGETIGDTLGSTGAFSPIVIDMIRTGEESGNLDAMLDKMSEFYESEATAKSTQVATIVGVLVFLCVAAYLGYVIISMVSGFASDTSHAAD